MLITVVTDITENKHMKIIRFGTEPARCPGDLEGVAIGTLVVEIAESSERTRAGLRDDISEKNDPNWIYVI
jgi:hypothetical protein